VHGRNGRRLSDGLARGCLREWSIRAADCLRSRSAHPATTRMRRCSRRMRGRAQLFLHQPSLGLSGTAMPGDHWTTSHLRGGRVNTSGVVSGLLTSRSWVLILCSLAAWSCGAATSKKPSADSSANQAGPMCAAPAFPPAPTCAGTCGNGVRDSCPYCAPQILIGGGSPGPGGNAGPACPNETTLETQTESCDGADLGAVSCASLGFTGGTLGCTSLCSFDTNGCDSCVSDSHSLACRHTELLANSPSSLALTASADEIAVAWVAGPGLLGNEPARPRRLREFLAAD